MAPLAREGRPDTRDRILEASIALLVERGYSGFSTRLVASRAGVSQGALQHHFRSRSELCVSAMAELLERISVEFVEAIPPIEDTVTRFEVVTDRLLAVFQGPSFVAGLELRLAARTDPELRQGSRKLESELDRVLWEGASAMFPELAGRQGFSDLIGITLASLRGLAVTNLDPDSDAAPLWRSMRKDLDRRVISILSEASA